MNLQLVRLPPRPEHADDVGTAIGEVSAAPEQARSAIVVGRYRQLD